MRVKKGDKVTTTTIKKEGTVVGFTKSSWDNSTWVGVEFIKRIHGGHSAQNKGKMWHCWYFPLDEIIILNK